MGLSRKLTRVLSFPLARDLIPAPEWVTPWTPPIGTDYPTTFSPTIRGGVGSTNGVWADGGLLVARHDSSTNWKSIRTVSGIADGTKVSCWMTVTGTSNLIGMGLGTSSASVEDWTGSTANGYTLFGHVADIYHNGGSVSGTTGTLAQGDRVRMDVDRVADTVQFYKQTGGTGSYVSMAAALDISGLGTSTLYPFANIYNPDGILTFDFGQGNETPGTGFTAGPTGAILGWTYPTLVDFWLASDTGRMWLNAGNVGVLSPNVTTAGNPIGGWYGVQYARLLSTATSANRPTLAVGGVLFDASGGLKELSCALASAITVPAAFTVCLRIDDVSVRNMLAGYGTSSTTLSCGQSDANDPKQRGAVRILGTTTQADFNAAVRTMVVTYDGAASAHILDADGNWITASVGANTANLTHIIMRSIGANAGVGTMRIMQIHDAEFAENDARDWQYWAENLLP